MANQNGVRKYDPKADQTHGAMESSRLQKGVNTAPPYAASLNRKIARRRLCPFDEQSVNLGLLAFLASLSKVSVDQSLLDAFSATQNRAAFSFLYSLMLLATTFRRGIALKSCLALIFHSLSMNVARMIDDLYCKRLIPTPES